MNLWMHCICFVENHADILPKDGKMNISPKELFSAQLIAIAVFAVSNLSFLTSNTPFSGTYSFEIGNIRTLVDIGGIAILYAHLIQCGGTACEKKGAGSSAECPSKPVCAV